MYCGMVVLLFAKKCRRSQDKFLNIPLPSESVGLALFRSRGGLTTFNDIWGIRKSSMSRSRESMLRLRTAIASPSQLQKLSHICPFASVARLSARSETGDAKSEEEHREARNWLNRFSVSSIPKGTCEVNFSRASGPGGQNVNKYVKAIFQRSSSATLTSGRVNSKATLRLRTVDFLPLVPKLLHGEILHSRYYAPNTESIVIQSDENRKQVENIKTCYQKLHHLVVGAGSCCVRGETSQAQIERVKALYVVRDLGFEDSLGSR